MKILILALVAIGFSCVDEAGFEEGLEQEVAAEASSQMEQGSNYTNIGDNDIYRIRLEDQQEVVAEILRRIQQDNNDDIQMDLAYKVVSLFANFGGIVMFLYQITDKYYHLFYNPQLLDWATDQERNNYIIFGFVPQSVNVILYLFLNEMNIRSPRLIWRFWHLVV